MCIIYIAINQHENYPLIVCANRDEFHQRPTKEMHVWPQQNILAGQDMVAGGTWLGLTPTGLFSALTNYRQPEHHDNDKKSRGELVIQALSRSDQISHDILLENADKYNGFNLIYGDVTQLNYFDSIKKSHLELDNGFHSICNGSITDEWPKMAKGKQLISDYLNTVDDVEIEKLLAILGDKQQANHSILPDTGIGEKWEQLLSSIFIQSEKYGTRSSTVITLDAKNVFNVVERNFSPQGNIISNNLFSGILDGPSKNFTPTNSLN